MFKSWENTWDSLQNPGGATSAMLFPAMLGCAKSTSCLVTGLSRHLASWIFYMSQEKICLGGQVRKKYSSICGQCTFTGICRPLFIQYASVCSVKSQKCLSWLNSIYNNASSCLSCAGILSLEYVRVCMHSNQWEVSSLVSMGPSQTSCKLGSTIHSQALF